MSDLFEHTATNKQKKNRVCRVAYTLNNNQPVISTIIGDQPLFYLDYDHGMEDDLLDAGELGILEDEIRKLKDGIESFDKFYEDREFSSDAAYQSYSDNLKSFSGVNAPTLNVKQLMTDLSQSRLGAAYLDLAAQHNIEIIQSNQVERSFYDRDAGKILINANLERPLAVMALVQELRTHAQHRNGALIQPLMFHPDNAILINRAQSADIAVSLVRVGWELQLAGDHDLWCVLENSSMADLARCFAREAFLDFRTINNGVACAAVFEAWFLSERCRNEDKELIQNMLADYQGYVFEAEDNSKGITAGLIAALGEMPYGKNYLAQHAMTILEDPIFTEVRDRSNANFLWFIKFERTFRETEQELQTSRGVADIPNNAEKTSGDDVLSSSKRSKQKDQSNGQNVSADIVTLYTANSASPRYSDESTDSQGRGESGKLLADPKIKASHEGFDNVVFLHSHSSDAS